MPFLLYIRLGCHLCEDARRLLAQLQIPHELRDIDEDEALRQQYDWLVPVLQHRASQRDLACPFDGEALLQFVSTVHHHD